MQDYMVSLDDGVFDVDVLAGMLPGYLLKVGNERFLAADDHTRAHACARNHPARGAKGRPKATPTNPISPLAQSRQPVIRCLGADFVVLNFLP
jgi:hypothetical protein